MGNTCKPMAVSFQCMIKSTTIKKKKEKKPHSFLILCLGLSLISFQGASIFEFHVWSLRPRSDFGAPKNKICHYFHISPFYLPWSNGTGCHDLSFFKHWISSQLFPLSLSSRDSLVPLHFLQLQWYHLHIWDCWYFSQQVWIQLVIHAAKGFTWCTLHIS